MLLAIRKDGTPFRLLLNISKKELMHEKEKEEFFCPECKEKVIMKLGSKRIAHFAHQKGSICVESYERESFYHLAGKLQLYHWLEAHKLNPILEPFYDSIRQRPDIGFSYHGKNYALEYQCSAIPFELMMKRTKRYQREGYIPIWILGGKNIIRKGYNKVSLSNFDYFFASKTPSGSWFLPSYCSSTKKFILLTNLTPVTVKNALVEYTIRSIQQFTVQQLVEVTAKSSISSEDWKREIRAQKLWIQVQKYHQSEFLRELYRYALNITLLPPIIGLPVQNAPIIESPPLIWQAYLVIDLLLNKKKGEIITFGDMYRCFMNRVQIKQIKLRPLPLVTNCNHLAAIAEYLHLLIQLQILEKLNTNTFRIHQEVIIPEHFVLQQELEDNFYKKYAKLLFK